MESAHALWKTSCDGIDRVSWEHLDKSAGDSRLLHLECDQSQVHFPDPVNHESLTPISKALKLERAGELRGFGLLRPVQRGGGGASTTRGVP